MTRWFQYGAFCPIFRIHGQAHKELYGSQFTATTQANLLLVDNLRYRLMPYIYSLAAMVTNQGYTIMRPLVMDYPSDVNARGILDQFLFGPAILVNPVIVAGATTRSVYLPAGQWIDFWTGNPLTGNQTITANAPLSEIPLYVKAGSIVPMGPNIQYATQSANPLEIRVYSGANGSFTLYEDENDNYDYEHGTFASIPMSYNDATGILTIGSRTGSFPGMLNTRTFNVVFVQPGYGVGVTVTSNPQTATYSGSPITFTFTKPTSAPYGGTPAAVPGTVQAENYDTGGQGIGYSVNSVNGTDNGYRSDGVDLEVTSDTGGGVDLGWTSANQWTKYTVNVASAGNYTVSFRVAAPTAVTDAFHLANSSGTNLSGNVNVPATGGFQTWTTVTANVTLPAGRQTLTLNQDNGGWNINDMSFATSGGGGAMTEQCSTLAESNTTGVTYAQITGGPNGEIACKLSSTGVGQFLQFTVTGIVQGTSYDVTIGYKSDPGRGQCQLTVGGVAQPQLATLDEYQSTSNWNQTADLGTWTAGAAGTTRNFTFTVSGKNSAATGYTMAPEWITLTPL
jgi:hypothetical protein